MILIALLKETSIHQSSKALTGNMVATNICVAFVVYWISILQGRWQTCHILFFADVTGANISLFASLCALSANSMDSPLVLLLGRRYRQLATLSQVYLVLLVVWVCPGIGNTVIFLLNFYGWKIAWYSVCENICLLLLFYFPQLARPPNSSS